MKILSYLLALFIASTSYVPVRLQPENINNQESIEIALKQHVKKGESL